MGWFIVILLVVYLGVMRYFARRYFALRHGVSLERGETGVLSASMIGATWPVMMFVPSVREPVMCGHHRHVLRHAQLVEEIRAADEIRRQRRAS